jgi:hypothetical protein
MCPAAHSPQLKRLKQPEFGFRWLVCRKIAKAKERAEAESTARPLKPEDLERLAEMQGRAKGEPYRQPTGRGGTVRRDVDSPAVAA